MPLPRIVFHLRDQELFELFVRSIPRPVLVDPLRNDSALRNRHFRGYRISKSSPDVPAISKAYYKEIDDERNGQLVEYLCRHWLLVHPELATGTLERLGLRNVDLRQTGDWLPAAHAALAELGYLNTATEIACALAFDHPIQDILIVVSILSVECEQQSELRQCVEDEFEKAHSDPRYLHAALTEQHTRLLGRLDHIESRRGEEIARCNEEREPIANELTQLTKKRTKLDGEGRTRENEVRRHKSELDKAQGEYDAAKALLLDWKKNHEKIKRSMSRGGAKLKDLDCSSEALRADLDRQKEANEADIEGIVQQLAVAKERMLHTGPAGAKSEEEVDQTSNREPAGAEHTGNLGEVLDFTALEGFTSSSATVDIFRVWLQGGPAQAPMRHTDCVTDPTASVNYYGYMALRGDPPWSAEALGNYALARSLESVREGATAYESRADILLGGLYHVERMSDVGLTDRLLARLVELIPDDGAPTTGRLDLSENLDRLAEHAADPAMSRRLGAVQTKLATANSRALQRLYDQMAPGLRAQAKRALVSRIKEVRLQENDPTHEVLDVVATHLETLLGPLGYGINRWNSQATLQDDVRTSRQALLAGTAKLLHVFSPTTNDRLAQFRDLFGTHLKDALAADTLDGYEFFRRLILQYCLRDCHQPEWISCRYLLPIAVSLAHVASRADQKARQRKADVRLVLEKQQHALNAVRNGVPLRVEVTNIGAATATDIHVEIEADRPEVTIRPKDSHLAKLGPRGRTWQDVALDIMAPISAVELACLYHWKDASGVQAFGEQTLKLTAQRDVDWARAQANPYSLRSIRSQERLCGRDGDLDALRIGIQGTQSFCITGQKRVGKTSVARVLLREFQDKGQHIAIYLTLGDLVTASWPELVYSLYEAIGDEMEDISQGSQVALPSVEEFVAQQAKYNRAFLRQLERRLNGMRILCVIDDFDELDERLYKGDEAKELFLRLRTLIDRGDFSFVMVGSEKLPDVLRHQGERLNQVQQHSLSYFRDKLSLRRLVVEPARPYLEYSEEAIDEIWKCSAGNPYYATQICNRVYGDMVARRDHHVCPSDVQRSVDAICEDSNVSTFQHFWTDGVFEGGLDMPRFQYLNAAILIACARLSNERGEPNLERQLLLKEPSLGSYDPAQVRFRLDNLVDRGVLVETADQVGLRVPLFERWLLERGAAAVRASFGEVDLEVRLSPTVTKPAPRKIVEIARNLVYQGQPLSEDRVRTWLDQFGLGENQKLALRLLERLKAKGYYDEAKVHAGCNTLHRLILTGFANEGAFTKVVEKRRIKNVFVSHFGEEGQSGGRILHVYRSANALAASLAGSMDNALEFVDELQRKGRGCAVVFIDDFIGTGGTCVGGLRVFGDKLRARGIGEDQVVVGVAALVGVRAGVEAVRTNKYVECQVVTTKELGPEDRAFAPEAGIFDGEDDRNAAARLCESIGKVLEPKQPLGFADCQSLVCFSHRCPNNTLPVFYKTGMMYQGQEWIPLFPR